MVWASCCIVGFQGQSLNRGDSDQDGDGDGEEDRGGGGEDGGDVATVAVVAGDRTEAVLSRF